MPYKVPPDLHARINALVPSYALVEVRGNGSGKYLMGTWHLRNAEGAHIASFTLDQLLGCCGICVSTDAYVQQKWRMKGLGITLNLMRIDIAKKAGYGVLLCTDLLSNAGQRRILSKNGWKDIHTFKNPRTLNDLAISIIDL